MVENTGVLCYNSVNENGLQSVFRRYKFQRLFELIMESPLLNRAQVCAYTGYSRNTLERWESEGNFPHKRKFGSTYSRVWYVKNEVEDWMNNRIGDNK